MGDAFRWDGIWQVVDAVVILHASDSCGLWMSSSTSGERNEAAEIR